MCSGLETSLIEPIDDGGFESNTVVAEGVIRLDLDMCGFRVSGLIIWNSASLFGPVLSSAVINKTGRLPRAGASFRKSHSLR
jgi:hypothetical protein